MKGFTLVEVLIVVVIVALVAAVSYWSFADFRDTQILDGGAELILGLLIQARQRTLSSDDASAYGVRFTANTVTLFKGPSFPGSEQEVLNLDPALAVSQINLAGGQPEVVFRRLSGATDQFGNLTLSLLADANRRRIISINASGLVELN